MTFTIRLSKEAANGLEELFKADRRIFNRIISKIEFLSENPKEGKPLVGNHKGEFSLRIGDYRVVYTTDNPRHTVYILTVKHRKHVY